MRTDMAPFNDVRVRRAISHAIDRQGLIEVVWGRGIPSPSKHGQNILYTSAEIIDCIP